MKNVKVDLESFDGKFDEKFDYCLMRREDPQLDLTYFSIPDIDIIRKRVENKIIEVDEETTILFFLNEEALNHHPKIYCLEAKYRKEEDETPE